MTRHLLEEAIQYGNAGAKVVKYAPGIAKAIPLVGFGLGMGSDMIFEKKTFGEALAHNGLTTAAGALGSGVVLGTAALLTTVGIATTAPAWLVVGAGIGLGLAADYVYKNNDWVKNSVNGFGRQIDKWLNPFNWGR